MRYKALLDTTDQFVFAMVGGQRFALDLGSGAVFSVNPEAERALRAGESTPAPVRTGASAGAPIAFAGEGVERKLLHCGTEQLNVNVRTGHVRFLGATPAEQRIHLLRLVVPYLLIARGVGVLHASAVLLDGEVKGFCGATGAGKSTLAQSLAQHGADWFSEDLLVIRDGAAITWAEQDLHAFLERQSSGGDGPVDLAEIARAPQGPAAPLKRIFFVGSRQGGAFSAMELTPAEAFQRLVANSFAEFAEASLWRRLFEQNAALADQVACAQLSVPDGLDLLESACADAVRQRSWL